MNTSVSAFKQTCGLDVPSGSQTQGYCNCALSYPWQVEEHRNEG